MLGARPEAHRQGRGPRALQGRDGEDWPDVPARGRGALGRGGLGRRAGHGLPRHPPPELHARRQRAAASPAREDEFDAKVAWALAQSPTHEVLIEESVLGWKEFELEVMRDQADNFIVVCSIENLDPMGVHTGDSITVAPAMTLTDREYQRLRDAARAVMTEIGVETGGVERAVLGRPEDGRLPRHRDEPARVALVGARAARPRATPSRRSRRSSPSATRSTSCKNDITRTSAAFEPVIDYVVVKWPRFAFEKFPGADATLGTQMKSVGEVMSIGRTFCEALQKAARSLETGKDGLVSLLGTRRLPRAGRAQAARATSRWRRPTSSCPGRSPPPDPEETRGRSRSSSRPRRADRLFYVADAMRVGFERRGALQAHAPSTPGFSPTSRRIVDAEERLRARRDLGPSTSARASAWASATARSRRSPAADEDDVRAARLRERHPRRVRARRHVRRRVRRAHAVPVLDLRVGERGEPRRRRAARSSSSAAVPTASGRGSSSTTAACTRSWRCASWGSRP